MPIPHDNPISTIDDVAFSVTRTIRISAPVSAVWKAVTEPALISRWFGAAEFDGFAVGARGTLSWPDFGSALVRIEAIDEPRSVTYRWSDGAAKPGVTDLDDAASTVFTFTLEERDAGTQLTVVETGFDTVANPAASLEDHRGGWDFELNELVDLLEGQL